LSGKEFQEDGAATANTWVSYVSMCSRNHVVSPSWCAVFSALAEIRGIMSVSLEGGNIME